MDWNEICPQVFPSRSKNLSPCALLGRIYKEEFGQMESSWVTWGGSEASFEISLLGIPHQYSPSALNIYSERIHLFFLRPSCAAHDKYSARIWPLLKFHQTRIKTTPLNWAWPRIMKADQSHYSSESPQSAERSIPTDVNVTIIKHLGESW